MNPFTVFTISLSAVLLGLGTFFYWNGSKVLNGMVANSASAAAANRLLCLGFVLFCAGYWLFRAPDLLGRAVDEGGLFKHMAPELGVVLLLVAVLHTLNMLILGMLVRRLKA